MKSRKMTSEEKFAIVMRGLKGEKSVSEICRENGLSHTMYLPNGVMLFLESRSNSYDHALEAEVEKLQKLIGKQAIEMEVLKNGRTVSEKIDAVKELKEKAISIKESCELFGIFRSRGAVITVTS